MPESFNTRISRTNSPWATREYSSPVSGSLRNKVARFGFGFVGGDLDDFFEDFAQGFKSGD